ncbi:MAG TPA: hypothetical protein PLS49_09680 [Candidatus Woesebacteria bacterium]|nr:hypothetical protein [Candidatus Woesebacteria bacterium]
MLIFYLLYYLFFIVSLLSIPYVTSYYILAGDPYLIVNSGYYYFFWLIIVIFIIGQAFSFTGSVYQCFVDNNNTSTNPTIGLSDALTRLLTNLHNVTLASFYTSIYITILGFGGYLGGVTAMDTIPAVKELLVGVIHIPGFEFILKGVPLALGGLIGNILASFCVTPACY